MRDLTINILLTRQEVNMGDHAETVWDAVAPVPGETVEDLVNRTLVKEPWRGGEKEIMRSTSLTIRVAEAPEPEETP